MHSFFCYQSMWKPISTVLNKGISLIHLSWNPKLRKKIARETHGEASFCLISFDDTKMGLFTSHFKNDEQLRTIAWSKGTFKKSRGVHRSLLEKYIIRIRGVNLSPETMKTRLLNPIFLINLLTMASAKGFDRQESSRTDFCARILIGLEISRKQLFYA